MQLLIVGLGSMGKRRARLLRGIAPDAVLCGVDANAARRAEAEGLGIPAYDSIGAAVAARAFDAALVCTAPLSHAAVIGARSTSSFVIVTSVCSLLRYSAASRAYFKSIGSVSMPMAKVRIGFSLFLAAIAQTRPGATAQPIHHGGRGV